MNIPSRQEMENDCAWEIELIKRLLPESQHEGVFNCMLACYLLGAKRALAWCIMPTKVKGFVEEHEREFFDEIFKKKEPTMEEEDKSHDG